MTPFSLSNRVRRILFGLAFVLISVGNLQAAYVVKKGDTFYSLARKNGVTVQALMKANGISDPSRLKIGMRLTVPSKSGSSVKRVSLRATTPAKATTSSRVTRSKTIILDPGHGGRDKGAVYGGVRESDLNLKTALKAERYLKSAGYKVVLTRRRDCYVSLARRASIANRYRNAVFISIHYNASHHSSVRGGETFLSLIHI